MLLLKEFELEIIDKKGSEKSMTDQLSCLHIPDMGYINDTFPNKHLLEISSHASWFAHIVNFLMT